MRSIDSIGSLTLREITLVAGMRTLVVDLDSALTGGDRFVVRRLRGVSDGSNLTASGELESLSKRVAAALQSSSRIARKKAALGSSSGRVASAAPVRAAELEAMAGAELGGASTSLPCCPPALAVQPALSPYNSAIAAPRIALS